MPKMKEVEVSLKLPVGEIKGTWEPDDEERVAAWEMYVELVTRISVAELKENEGFLREALSSLYTLFDTTRKILRDHGPTVVQPKGNGNLSFGHLAVKILNNIIRPVLAYWHPVLSDYENTKPDDISLLQHEKNWKQNKELRQVLNDVRFVLIEYSNILAQVAGIPNLLDERTTENNNEDSEYDNSNWPMLSCKM